MANGYLVMPDAAKVDLKIIQQKDSLVFRADDHIVFQIPLNQFYQIHQKYCKNSHNE